MMRISIKPQCVASKKTKHDSAMKKTSDPTSPVFSPVPPKVYEYPLAEGWVVLAGKTDLDNDVLSLKTAGPNDWWFHVRGMPGSHVILVGNQDQAPSSELIRQAAAIAAYHSKARDGGTVPVSATLARYVSKPRGAKPGTVTIRKEVVLKVRPGIPKPPS
jgi:predicted ribosome quality control (RQC) complex YloA/Tae2 family protein